MDVLRESLDIFQGEYEESAYAFICDPHDAKALYVYNPETIVKINMITADEIAEKFYI